MRKKSELKFKFLIPVILAVAGIGWAYKDYSDYNSTELVRMQGEVAAKNREISTKKQELKNLQDFVGNIEKIKEELRELNVQLETALEHMPPTFDLSGLLRKFTLLAQNSGLEIATFVPKKTEERAAGSFYSSISINFDLQGTFSQTVAFLDQLSRLKRIVNIEGVDISAEADAKTIRSGAIIANTKALVRTYRFAE